VQDRTNPVGDYAEGGDEDGPEVEAARLAEGPANEGDEFEGVDEGDGEEDGDGGFYFEALVFEAVDEAGGLVLGGALWVVRGPAHPVQLPRGEATCWSM
jgi:hypothetical protein